MPVKEHAKKHGVNYAKLLTGITLLTAAVNGYLDLAKQNELMLQALGSKLNNISVKVAFLEGRMSVAPVFWGATPDPVRKVSVRALASVEADDESAVEGAEAEDSAYTMLHSEGEAVAYVGDTEESVESDEPSPVQMQIQLDAYEDVALSMDALKEQAQEQVQEQVQEQAQEQVQ